MQRTITRVFFSLESPPQSPFLCRIKNVPRTFKTSPVSPLSWSVCRISRDSAVLNLTNHPPIPITGCWHVSYLQVYVFQTEFPVLLSMRSPVAVVVVIKAVLGKRRTVRAVVAIIVK